MKLFALCSGRSRPNRKKLTSSITHIVSYDSMVFHIKFQNNGLNNHNCISLKPKMYRSRHTNVRTHFIHECEYTAWKWQYCKPLLSWSVISCLIPPHNSECVIWFVICWLFCHMLLRMTTSKLGGRAWACGRKIPGKFRPFHRTALSCTLTALMEGTPTFTVGPCILDCDTLKL